VQIFCNKIHFYGEKLLKSVLLTQYISGDKIEKNDMGGLCSAYGVEERHIQGFCGET